MGLHILILSCKSGSKFYKTIIRWTIINSTKELQRVGLSTIANRRYLMLDSSPNVVLQNVSDRINRRQLRMAEEYDDLMYRRFVPSRKVPIDFR